MEFDDIIKSIPIEPYYRDPQSDIVIYCSDCRLVLPFIPDNSIDLVLTDPPYGFNRFETDGKDFMEVIKDAFQTMPLKDGAWAFVFTGTGEIKNLLNSIPLDYQRLLWLYKPADCTFPYRGWLLTSEAIALFSNGKPQPLNDRKPYRHDCYLHYTVGQEGVEGHPTVKPHAVIEDLVLRCVEGGLILDPFLGSGTTAYCAKKLGRKCIGIEIEEKYCEISAKRLSQSVMKFSPQKK